ncbi:MAG: hypothetical protein ACJ75Q_12835, partial [Gaiellaceae bacterium]
MLRSLRTRLALLFAGTLLLAAVLGFAASIRLYQSYNRDQTTRDLQGQVEGIAAYYEQALKEVYSTTGQRDSPPPPPRATAEQLSQITGSRLYWVGGLPPFPKAPANIAQAGIKPPFDPLQLARDDRPKFEFTPKGDDRTFIGVSAPVYYAGVPQGAVVLSKPLADINNAWTDVAGRVAAGTGLGLLVAFFLAAFFSRRITKPLRRIGAAA